MGGKNFQLGAALINQPAERKIFSRIFAGDDHVPQKRTLGPARRDLGEKLLSRHDHFSAAVIEKVGEIRRSGQDIDRHRYRADLHRPEKRRHEFGTVG